MRGASLGRRDLLRGAGALALSACARGRGSKSEHIGSAREAASVPRELADEPIWGVQSGDVTPRGAVVWCRAHDRARMIVEWSTSPRFERVTRIEGPVVGHDTDFVGKVGLDGLPIATTIHYRVGFERNRGAFPWVHGSFETPSLDRRDVLLAWSGDTNGQGWGIDPTRGGMPGYAALLARSPDLFVHCGDAIYADDPIPPAIALDDGGVWNNLVDPAKAHVAQTLQDFRGAHRYPRLSAEVRALSAKVPLFSIWDDHEVRNNWFPGETIEDTRYDDPRVDLLAGPARRAMYEYTPTLLGAGDPMYRVVHWGPLLDLFLLDGRSYRTPNEPAPVVGALLGERQATWLVDALSRSRAHWKVVACDMPIGCVVSEPGRTGAQANDGWANQDGPPSEREVELAELLRELRRRAVKNVVWITADVHYCAAHRMDPTRAAFKDFDPFWELVAGPMHATAFPRKPLDDTFGAELEWSSADGTARGSRAPVAAQFGLLHIDGRTMRATATFVDARGRDLHRLTLDRT